MVRETYIDAKVNSILDNFSTINDPNDIALNIANELHEEEGTLLLSPYRHRYGIRLPYRKVRDEVGAFSPQLAKYRIHHLKEMHSVKKGVVRLRPVGVIEIRHAAYYPMEAKGYSIFDVGSYESVHIWLNKPVGQFPVLDLLFVTDSEGLEANYHRRDRIPKFFWNKQRADLENIIPTNWLLKDDVKLENEIIQYH